MKVLSKAELVSGELLRRKLIDVPDWGASVWMKELSGDVVRDYKRRVNKYKSAGVTDVPDDDAADMMTALLAHSICDEDGNLLFATEEEARALTVNGLNTLTYLVNKAFEVSGAKQDESGDVVSEVTADLPNETVTTSSPENSPSNSDEPELKS